MSKLSASEFREIVDAVAADHRRIASVSARGFEAQVMVKSRSGKKTWQADCEFDPQTGHVACYAAYPEAGELHLFVDDVVQRLRARGWPSP